MASTETRPPMVARGPVRRLSVIRDRVRGTRAGLLVWRAVISVFGVAVIVVGIALLALPGPGWLIIFAGLGILATEFDWASRLLSFARREVSAWTSWVGRQSRAVQGLLGLAGLIVLAAVCVAVWWFYTR